MKLIIYTDGASRGNPGYSSYGFSISDQSGNVIYEEGKYLGVNTNNFAEYSAVLEALNYAKKNLLKDVNEIDFFMDSKLVVEQLSGRYKVKSKTLKPLIEKIRELEKSFNEISYTHVPRAKNEVADSLANLALDSRI